MLRASATSLMLTRRFLTTIFFTFSMLSLLTVVDGRLAWGKFSTTSLNALCHLNTCVLDRVDSPKYFCNISNDSVAVIPLETHNFKQTRCSIFFSIVKIARQTFRVVNQWLPNTHQWTSPAQTSHDCQRRCYQPRKNLFTVSVYARGLIGPVGVIFDQMVYSFSQFSNEFLCAITVFIPKNLIYNFLY